MVLQIAVSDATRSGQPAAAGLKACAAAWFVGWNDGVGAHQVPPDWVSNSGLKEELDQRIGTAAAHAVRNVPVAEPDERVAAVLDGMRGSTFDSAVVEYAQTGAWSRAGSRWSRLGHFSELAAPADAALGSSAG